ncbi:MAG: SDR family oxidoreductase [Halieaceae bacterium]|nr:SDR family oxidoreductase [Halieaceae bacterium]MCP5163802.1 SDR family oxidoreductase [Pseudomonadales bacterium]MCP5202852.1 SDR family oxidoreductase [Pseudomonadales bacterium]
MDLQISGKKAIMAGGSAGMGRATAERLAEAGVELYISARRQERLEKAAREIADKYGVRVTPVVADSSTEEGRQALFAACPDPDILAITIKPPSPNGDFLQIPAENWRDSVETALIGPIEIMRHYIPVMKKKGWGRIVNIATFSAKNPMAWRLMSGPARSALVNYTACVSREIAQYGVIINNILPGIFATEGMEESWEIYVEAFGLEKNRDIARKHFIDNNPIPAGFMGDADDMAPMAALLCSPLARFIVGQNIVIDGGQHRSLF